MIITKLAGGLGNQMFQYAIGRTLSLENNTVLKMDLSFLLDRITPRDKNFVYRNYDLDIFRIEENFATSEEAVLLKKKLFNNNTIDSAVKKITGRKKIYFKEKNFHFSDEVFHLDADIYLDGYWQSPKYFRNYENIIRKDFTLKKIISNKSLKLLDVINNNNSVCVNVRRGDFVTTPLHGAMGTDYYKNAESIIKANKTNLHFFVFSDDIEWCEKNLRFSETTTFVSHEYAGEKFSEYLELMKSCKYFIIPNSTFAWWAAWLNNDAGKIVVAPAKWFNKGKADTKDLIPAEWLRI